MTLEEREEVKREALLRALAIVQQYQDENWRRLRVNDICFEIKRLIREEATRRTGADAEFSVPLPKLAR
jgi:hypothetical protein